MRFVLEVPGKFLQFAELLLASIVLEKPVFGEAGRLAGERKVRRGVVSVEDKGELAVGGAWLGDACRESLAAEYAMALAVKSGHGFCPVDCLVPRVGLFAHFEGFQVGDDERVAVYFAALGKEDGRVFVERTVVAEVLDQLVDSRLGEESVEVEFRNGLFDKPSGNVPVEKGVERLHLPESLGFFLPNVFFQAVDFFFQFPDFPVENRKIENDDGECRDKVERGPGRRFGNRPENDKNGDGCPADDAEQGIPGMRRGKSRLAFGKLRDFSANQPVRFLVDIRLVGKILERVLRVLQEPVPIFAPVAF